MHITVEIFLFHSGKPAESLRILCFILKIKHEEILSENPLVLNKPFYQLLINVVLIC
jgi:hypothetical protein